MPAKRKLNSIETLVSKALIDLETNHEFETVINKKEKYEKMKKSIRYTKSSDEKNELSENSKNIRENNKYA